jgi:uncharacterized protein with HEPN domain
MSPEIRERLRDIVREAEFLQDHISGLDQDTFLRNEVLKRAFIRSIEVIGEASKNVPEQIRILYPTLDWRKMSGMRNRLIHDYNEVDYAIVWDVAFNKAPELAAALRQILRSVDAAQQ